MAQTKNIKSTEFDSVVIGSSLAGLIVAHQLEGTGRKVALVEGLDSVGGSCRPATTMAGPADNSVKFFSDTPETIEALEWLGTVLGEPIEFERIEAPAVTYDDGKFKPFVGFGDQKIETANEISAYATASYLRLKSTPKDWVPKLAETFTGDLFSQSYVTKMLVEDDFVMNILINGSKQIIGREVFFCAAPQQLTRLLPDAVVPAKLRQKLLKGEFWTSINLEMIHNGQITESKAAHVLKGANEEPSVGFFFEPTTLEDGRTIQVSKWVTLVPRDITDEPEHVASALKQIKRQVKRAYEHSTEGIIQERIVVSPTSHGDMTGVFADNGVWPKVQNLWLVTGFMDASKNLVGSIRQARRTLAAVAGEPAQVISRDTDLSEGPHPTA